MNHKESLYQHRERRGGGRGEKHFSLHLNHQEGTTNDAEVPWGNSANTQKPENMYIRRRTYKTLLSKRR